MKIFRSMLLSSLLSSLSFVAPQVFAEQLNPGDPPRTINGADPTPLTGENGPLFEINTSGGNRPIILNINRSLKQTTTLEQAKSARHPTDNAPFNTHNSVITAVLPVGQAPVTVNITYPIEAKASSSHKPHQAYYSPALSWGGNWTTNLTSTVKGDVQLSHDFDGNNKVVLNLGKDASIQGNVYTTAEVFDEEPTPRVGTINFQQNYTTKGTMRGLANINMDTQGTVNVGHNLYATDIKLKNGILNLTKDGILQSENTLKNDATLRLSGGSVVTPVEGTGSIQVMTGSFKPQGNITGQKIVMKDGTDLTVGKSISITGNQAIELEGRSKMTISGGTVAADILGETNSSLLIEAPFTASAGKRIQAGTIQVNAAGTGGQLTTSNTNPISGFSVFEIHQGGSAKISGNVTSSQGGSITNRGELFVSGGTISANALSNLGKLNIEGGTLNTPINNSASDAMLVISGGTFNRMVKMMGGKAMISGGTFNDKFHHHAGEVLFKNANIQAPAGFANDATLVLEGTSTITGHYSQSNSGVLSTTVVSPANFGKLQVNGNAVLDPGATVKVALDPNHGIKEGDVLDIITATNGSFANANVIVPENLPFKFRKEISGNQLRLTASRTEYLVQVAETPHNQTVAKAIEDLRFSHNDPNLKSLINMMDNSSKRSINDMLNSLSPNNSRELFFSGMTHTSMASRKGLHRISLGRIDRDLLALDNADLLGLKNGYNAGDECCNGFMSFGPIVFGNTIRQRKIDNFNGFQSGTEGLGLLADVAMNDCFQLGVGALYAASQVRNEKDCGRLNINSAEAMVYGGYNWDGLFLDGSAVIGENWYRSRRHIPITRQGFLVNSKHRGFQYSGKLLAGYDLGLGRTIVTPLASIEYFHLHQGSFLERGIIHRFTATSNSHLGQAAAGIKLSFIEECQRFVPEVHLLYLRDLNNPKLQTTSQFTGGGGPAFVLTGPTRFPKNAVNVGFGLTAFIFENVLLTGTYDFEGKKGYKSHSGTARLRWIF